MVIYWYIFNQWKRPNSVMTFPVLYKRLLLLTEHIHFSTSNTAKTMYQILNFEKEDREAVSGNLQQTMMYQSSEYNDERQAFSNIMNTEKRGKQLTTYSSTTLDRSHKPAVAIGPYFIPGREPQKINKSRQSWKISSSRKQLKRLWELQTRLWAKAAKQYRQNWRNKVFKCNAILLFSVS